MGVKLPYWLRGGLIGAIFILIFLIIDNFYPMSESVWYILAIPIVPLAIILWSVFIPGSSDLYMTVVETIFFIVGYFIIGAIIGLIFRKIKKKK